MEEVPQETTTMNPTHPVLVTGATGYVAGWIVKELLDRGLTVHAAVRDPSNAAKLRHLQQLADQSPGAIQFFAADLLEPGSYDAAAAGCRIVFHTASPFTSRVRDPETQLIVPAVEGTRNVLETVNRTECVTRVVLTSSCAAMYTDAKDSLAAPGGKLTEEIWNTTASLDYQPYNYSKLLAEREAWSVAEAQDRWRLVAINPSLVIGPALNPAPTSASFGIVKTLGDGTLRFGAPRVGMGVVDVRDVANAHVAAATQPTAHGRYIVSAHETDLLEMSRSLHDAYGSDYPLPSRPLPKPLVWLLSPGLTGLSRRFVTNNVNIPFRADNSKGRRDLGISYRPLAESMCEMFAGMIAAGDFR